MTGRIRAGGVVEGGAEGAKSHGIDVCQFRRLGRRPDTQHHIFVATIVIIEHRTGSVGRDYSGGTTQPSQALRICVARDKRYLFGLIQKSNQKGCLVIGMRVQFVRGKLSKSKEKLGKN